MNRANSILGVPAAKLVLCVDLALAAHGHQMLGFLQHVVRRQRCTNHLDYGMVRRQHAQLVFHAVVISVRHDWRIAEVVGLLGFQQCVGKLFNFHK